MEIYILRDAQSHGPYSQHLIRQYLKSGHIKPDDLAAYKGKTDWKPLFELMQAWGAELPTSGRRLIALHKSSKLKLIAKIAVGILVAAAAGVGGWYWLNQRKLDAVVLTLPNDNLPHSLGELNASYVEPPEGRNAARFFQPGLDALQVTDADRKLPGLGMGESKTPLPAPGSALSAGLKKEIADLVARNQTAVTAFQQGLKADQSRWPIDLAQGAATPLPHLAKIKQAAQVSALVAIWQADAKQPTPAAGSVLITLALAHSLASEPLVISQNVRASCNTLAVEALEQVFNRVALPPDSLAVLQKRFQLAETPETSGENFTRAVVGLRTMAFDGTQQPLERLVERFSNPESGVPSDQRSQLPASLKHLKSEWPFIEATFQQLLEARKQPFPDRLKADAIVKQRNAEAATRKLNSALLLQPAGAFSATEARSLAHLRLGLTAVALERYRAAHQSQYPPNLNELTPQFLTAVPQDPSDGQALRYKVAGEGYELESVSPDQKQPVTFTVVKPPKAILATAARSAPTP